MDNLTTTNIYKREKLIRSEKRCTFVEYVQMNRLKSGQLILLEDKGNGTETFIVGDCTPFMQPSETDGGIGWDWKHSRMYKGVVEVHELR